MASPRLSLRWQIAIWAVGFGLVFASLGFVGTAPLVQQAALRGSAAPMLALLAGLSALAGLALAFAVYALLVRTVARPADRLLRATERIGAQGGAPTLVAEEGPVFTRLGTAFDRMSGRLLEEQRRVEAQLDELRRVNRELTLARDAMVAQEKMAMVGRLSAGIAHEIGNPLAAILGYVEVAQTTPAGRGLAPMLERMEQEGRRIDRIVRDLLDFAKPRPADNLQPLEAELVARRAVRLVEGQGRFRGVAVSYDFAPGLPRVMANPHQLQQVLVNLLVNAADAMAGAGTLVVGARFDGRAVLLSVRDRGPGIDPAVLPRLFEPFFTTKDPGAGTGLGLAICHSLVQAIGGSIAARNHPDGGAVFEVRLPVVEESKAPPARIG
ncbi:sensor histidine kinase [Vulgatibacter sp.]|uniref:sensor histidine kinase n=1 Tax=Vulgatibacter sp. TaxID=1971226 RepID=UPI003564671C